MSGATASAFDRDRPPPSRVPAAETPPERTFGVADICRGMPDSAGRPISRVFVKKSAFAIYEAEGQVFIQFSDDPGLAAQQAGASNPLLGPRRRLEYLAGGLSSERYYTQQIATALQAALEGDLDDAKAVLADGIADATGDRARVGRKFYLLAAGILAIACAAPLIAAGGLLRHGAMPTGMLLLSAGGGAIGAFFSIAIAIRARTVAPENDRNTNLIDGGLRISIGVIAGFALHLLLTGGFLSSFTTGNITAPAGGDEAMAGLVARHLAWRVFLVLGFVGGFFERLVPDLLERQQTADAATTGAKTTDPG